MAAAGTGERWVNPDDKDREGLYRVEVPGEGALLVRADSERQAAELAAGAARNEAGTAQATAADLLGRGAVEPLTYPKVTVHDSKDSISGNPQVEVILETPRGCVSLTLQAEGSMQVNVGPADYPAYEVLTGNVEEGKRAVYAIDYGDEKEHLMLDDREEWWRRR